MANRNFFSHCDLDTKTLPWDRMKSAGYSYNRAGENIAAGYSSAAAVMTTWMNSSGHRANILSPSFREIGVGYVYQSNDQANVRTDANGDCAADAFNGGPYRHYWTQNFGTRNSVFPAVINREAPETTSRQVSLYLYGEGWATQVRLRNESGAWSSWRAFSPSMSWRLSAGNGSKRVSVQLRNSAGTVRSTEDYIRLVAP